MSDPTTQLTTLAPPVSDQRDHVQGPRAAPVTLVEYGDFECPYCGQAYPVVKELLSRQGTAVRLVFRNFPLAEIHPHARRAAEAAEAAGAQGKFWEMHDLLYERQDALEDEDLVAYAAEIGLDLDRFQVELAQNAHAARVREDFMSGVRSGVNGTPTFFINGRRHDGNWDLASLTEAVMLASGPAPQAHGGHAHHRPHA
jgi:protein-disulfide isomerase